MTHEQEQKLVEILKNLNDCKIETGEGFLRSIDDVTSDSIEQFIELCEKPDEERKVQLFDVIWFRPINSGINDSWIPGIVNANINFFTAPSGLPVNLSEVEWKFAQINNPNEE